MKSFLFYTSSRSPRKPIHKLFRELGKAHVSGNGNELLNLTLFQPDILMCEIFQFNFISTRHLSVRDFQSFHYWSTPPVREMYVCHTGCCYNEVQSCRDTDIHCVVFSGVTMGVGGVGEVCPPRATRIFTSVGDNKFCFASCVQQF